ncbi:MAG: putative amidohydrolase YtcJ [Oceanicoccus sp.]|jgi:predicted amidohydrolase YtcJ
MLLIKRAEVFSGARKTAANRGLGLVDIRCRGSQIVAVNTHLEPESGEVVIDANGGAVIPGLQDHHIHLLALTAAGQSLACGPPAIENSKELANALQACAGSGWIRGVGYHESVAGLLHREQLDEWVFDRPVRIQHRSGKMWFVNSFAAELLQLDRYKHLTGIETDHDNKPSGRLFRLDEWMRQQLSDGMALDIKSTSALLASFGVTGVTDATATNNLSTWDFYRKNIERNDVMQRILLMGDSSLSSAAGSLSRSGGRLECGVLKILLDDALLPNFYELVQRIDRAHEQKCPVAIHCVTAVELVFALSACKEAGYLAGDRIEHASVVNDSAIDLLQKSGLTVATQPNFIGERGDQYAIDIDAGQHQYLYRVKTLLDAGVPVGGSTDAPFGNPDPWRSMVAAVNRQSPSGMVLGAEERVTPEQALKLFTSSALSPGGPMRKTAVGDVADLCLLDRPWHEARLRLQQKDVKATIRGGEIIYQN